MKLKAIELRNGMNPVRNRGPRSVYREMYACDQTRGSALEVRGGRLVEVIARRKSYFELYE